MITLLCVLYFYIGVFAVFRRAMDIAFWEIRNPNSDVVVFITYTLTWPAWVLRK